MLSYYFVSLSLVGRIPVLKADDRRSILTTPEPQALLADGSRKYPTVWLSNSEWLWKENREIMKTRLGKISFLLAAVIASSDQAATSQPAPKTIRVSAGVARANLTRKVDPSYPTEAKVKRIEGDVDLQILIDTGGCVKQILPISGDPILIAAAVAAVKQWTYKPTLLNSEPVNVQTMVKVRFQTNL